MRDLTYAPHAPTDSSSTDRHALQPRHLWCSATYATHTMNSITASAYKGTWLLQAKTAAKEAQPQAGPTAEERAAAIAALRARQQQKRRASQAADADTGTAVDGAAQPEAAASGDGGAQGRTLSPAAIAPERCEPSRAVCCGMLIPAPFAARTGLMAVVCVCT